MGNELTRNLVALCRLQLIKSRSGIATYSNLNLPAMKNIKLLTTAITLFSISILLTTADAFAQAPVVYNFSTLSQPVNDIIYLRSRRVIYASVPSTGGSYGNSIIAIDPFSKQIVGSVFVGSEPNRIAVSDDDQYLYVGLDGAAAIRRVILDTMSADIQFSLGSGSNGIFFAEDIAVLPNFPDSVAVSRRNSCCSPRHEGVAIYDSGVMRPTTTPGHTGSNAIESGGSASVLYGYNNETTDFGFRRMAINATGVSVVTNLQNIIQGFNVDIRYSNGRLYSTTGTIIDPVANTLVGTFAVGGFSNGVAADAIRNRVFYISGSSISGFNSTNFQPTGSVSLSVPAHSFSRLLRWGRRGLAYRTGDGRIAFFETSLVPAQPNVNDFNGDELAEYSVFRPSSAQWFASSGPSYFQFGVSSDKPVAADYDGDNKTDVAVYRSGLWYVFRSATQSVSTVSFGLGGDMPVPADYDGDHKIDNAVYRNGQWHVLTSSDGQYLTLNFGLPTDIPTPADFDGDGKTDFAVYRPTGGTWYVMTNGSFQTRAVQFGSSLGRPAVRDYDGDGRADFAVWQNTFGSPVFYILRGADNSVVEYLLDGNDNSVPFSADFDGDGASDPAVFDLSGNWTVRRSGSGTTTGFHFGISGDLMVAPR